MPRPGSAFGNEIKNLKFGSGHEFCAARQILPG
jgi:hypothetical protein